jgi:hypothetical protein
MRKIAKVVCEAAEAIEEVIHTPAAKIPPQHYLGHVFYFFSIIHLGRPTIASK